jgi:4-hydroxybenzoate polyprenyltransferase
LTTVRTKNSLLNPTTFFLGLLAPIPIVVYPLIKRYNLPDQWQHSRASWLLRPQLFLGLTFNWGAMMGYSAVTDNIDLAVQIPLYLGCVAWTVMYDTVYALQEKLQILFHNYWHV